MGLQNKTNQKFISALLIVAILMPAVLFFIPKKVIAEDSKVSAAACMAVIAKGIISKKVKAAIEVKAGAATVAATSGAAVGWPVIDASNAASNIGTTTRNIKFGIDLGDTAENTQSQLEFKYADCIEKVVTAMLTALATKLLAKMTESTINWINTGFHGAPLFLENPGSFFKDIAKSEIRNMVNTIGNNSATQPFGKSTAINIINSYKSTFEQNAQYSLSKVTNDTVLLNNFRNDFSVGGWDGFLLQTQFPQNNYIGYNMMVADELVRKVTGKQSAVTDALNQGQGFLSPQTCPTNSKYNNLKNQFQRPVFKSTLTPPRLESCSEGTIAGGACMRRNEARIAEYELDLGSEKLVWNEQNSCPGGLVNTTPGSVVASQIMTATSSTFRQGELGKAMGNSLSAIFDALLNKLMSSGLNALSSKISGAGSSNNNDDDFNYNGQTLGTAPSNTNNTGFNWNSPDEIIVLSTFKRDVRNAIDNGNKEIKLIDGNASTGGVNNIRADIGILQVFNNIWPKAQELDMCLPGPNIGWEGRIDTDKNSQISDGAEAFKTWVLNKMKIELPSSNSYLTTVNSIKTINSQTGELNYRVSSLTETLIKLNSINAELSTLTTEPNPGSAGEATLIRLKQRYDGLFADLPSASSVIDVQNKLADAKDKLSSLSALLAKCTTERTAKGWSNPGGVDSVSNAPGIIAQTEKSVFCSSYSGGAPVSCEVVFKTEIGDYKK